MRAKSIFLLTIPGLPARSVGTASFRQNYFHNSHQLPIKIIIIATTHQNYIELNNCGLLKAKAELAAARSINKESGKESEEKGGERRREDPMLAALKHMGWHMVGPTVLADSDGAADAAPGGQPFEAEAAPAADPSGPTRK